MYDMHYWYSEQKSERSEERGFAGTSNSDGEENVSHMFNCKCFLVPALIRTTLSWKGHLADFGSIDKAYISVLRGIIFKCEIATRLVLWPLEPFFPSHQPHIRKMTENKLPAQDPHGPFFVSLQGTSLCPHTTQ